MPSLLPLILYAITAALALGYATLMWRYLYHWADLPQQQVPPGYLPRTHISVLVAARNEEASIGACVQSILAQDYPPQHFDLTVIDDHSTDGTAAQLAQFHDPRLQVLPLADFAHERQLSSPKKAAIATGIQKSTGHLIVTTDADCIVPPRWLRSIAYCHEHTGAQFIAAPVAFQPEQGLLGRFQSLDFAGMMLLTGAGIQGRFQYLCNGANLAYTRDLFHRVGGFSGTEHLASGDDMFLQHKVLALQPSTITFLKDPAAIVLTAAQPHLRAFISQRLRWASKSAQYGDLRVTAILAGVFFLCWGILLSGLLSWAWPSWFLPVFMVLLTTKALADYLMLRRAARWFGRQDLMRSFLAAQAMHILYIASIGLLANLVKKYQWKGRALR